MIDPVVTYRIQFHKNFTFRHLEEIVPYLERLGVGAVYASPIFEAVPGSLHGYDGVNPHRINPEIGTEAELKRISKQLRDKGITWIQDIVPNHMAFHPNNIWLMDVLEKGRYSVYANFFDLAWAGDLFRGRVIVPVLGAPTEDVLFNKEMQLAFEQQRFVLRFYDNCYPLHPRSYRLILEGDGAPDAVRQLTDQIAALHQEENPVAYSLRWHELVLQLDALMQTTAVSDYVHECLSTINRDGIALKQILDAQTYTLTPWQVTDRRITFRRFFTVNELIGVNVHDEKVFEHYHRYVKALVDEGTFSGLRIDHIDGLYDPVQYTERLRALVGDEVPIYVEKILKPGEALPPWPVQGATGYEFMGWVNQLMTYAPAAPAFKKIYDGVLGKSTDVAREVYEKKAYILNQHMRGELDNLYHLFVELNLIDNGQLTPANLRGLKDVIGEFLIQCPVYRFYGNVFPLQASEAAAIKNILKKIRTQTPQHTTAVDLLESALLQHDGDADKQKRAAQFYKRCMQFTGPLMAKGFEDTLFYTYNAFIGHNEVGDSPEMFGMPADMFHRLMTDRLQHWPLSLNGTSTHDTKRGEDARARLNVLTELPDQWDATVQEWNRLATPFKTNGMPDANDTYFIFQTLAGTYPLSHHHAYPARLQEYITKALRESKRNSDWASPDAGYEKAVEQFIAAMLERGTPFFDALEQWLHKITDGGLINSLSQVVLKFTCPGIPDVYQGCEGLDFSLVDPDNRQLIDYEQHRMALVETAELDDTQRLEQLWKARADGRLKQWLVSVLANLRTQHNDAFRQGDYLPLAVRGKHASHVFAFARHHGTSWFVTVVPLHATRLAHEHQATVRTIDWHDTTITLPAGVPASWRNVLTGQSGKASASLPVADVLKQFPVAVLAFNGQANPRGAGILMHITSLPTVFAIGDLGPGAHAFADFLNQAGQTYWQLLPLNPTSGGCGHSPYSAFSSMAGNTLLISPEMLAKDGLLQNSFVKKNHKATSTVDYDAAQQEKDDLLQQAWQSFLTRNDPETHAALDAFAARENYWLHDFALYCTLKNFYNNAPWNEWALPHRQRSPEALQDFARKHDAELQYIKWQQYVFHTQWQHLKQHANKLGIQLFGDLPFYVVYDSADVWAHRNNFSLDQNGAIRFMAGVPPDYFNDKGQLWGMPVFDWKNLRAQGYTWWIQRLQKNMEMFDLLRLDHFRAFAGYWQVAAGEQTAVNGHWVKGPGEDFFNTVSDSLGALPFIAEDLGDITPDVHALREAFGFPGMKVLQFAFGNSMPQSLYIPHNYENTQFVAYTGTHDNNTTRGWFTSDMTPADQATLSDYTGINVNGRTVSDVLTRLAYASVAARVIIPMQDVLNLDGASRMNKPGSANDNWKWRLPAIPKNEITDRLREMAIRYNRTSI